MDDRKTVKCNTHCPSPIRASADLNLRVERLTNIGIGGKPIIAFRIARITDEQRFRRLNYHKVYLAPT